MTWGTSGVAVRFGSTRALDGVDFAVEPGRVHTVIGGDGSGKSTLLRVLAGVRTADEGPCGDPRWATSPSFRPAGVSSPT
jgi:ABC-type sugar transport system ATPase subunit